METATPEHLFVKADRRHFKVRINAILFVEGLKDYIVNLNHIDSFDVNDIYIGMHELAIGSHYRDGFIERFMKK